MTAVWDDRLLSRDTARFMADGWRVHTETRLRCAMPATEKDGGQLGRDICGQSVGVVTEATTPDERTAMIVRHMLDGHGITAKGYAGVPDRP